MLEIVLRKSMNRPQASATVTRLGAEQQALGVPTCSPIRVLAGGLSPPLGFRSCGGLNDSLFGLPPMG